MISLLWLLRVATFAFSLLWPSLWGQAPAAPIVGPEITAVFPPGTHGGSIVRVEFRGKQLAGTYGLWSAQGLQGTVQEVSQIDNREPEQTESYQEKKSSEYRVMVKVQVPAQTAPGLYPLRLLSSGGLTNSLPFYVRSGIETQATEEEPHTPEAATSLPLPALVYGRIGTVGQVNYYRLEIAQAQHLAFDVWRPDTTFEPQLTLYSVDGTWLNPDRPHRLELSKTSPKTPHSERWSYPFREVGTYLLRVGSKHGQASESFSYELQIKPDDADASSVCGPEMDRIWSERSFERVLSPDHLKNLRKRTLLPEGPPPADSPPTRGRSPVSQEAADHPL